MVQKEAIVLRGPGNYTTLRVNCVAFSEDAPSTDPTVDPVIIAPYCHHSDKGGPRNGCDFVRSDGTVNLEVKCGSRIPLGTSEAEEWTRLHRRRVEEEELPF
ncbi:hypothetical protein KKD61_05155 [Patescibacteria group bacterium]|nr:hypothetical protein [Patescibacteria group bacterium]